LIDDFNVFLQGTKIFKEVNEISGTAYVSGNTMEVVSINYNQLGSGIVVSGSNLNLNTTIISQISGTTGGIGLYLIEPAQVSEFVNPSVSTKPFVVTNKTVGGFSSQNIQSGLNDKFRMVLSNSAIITKGQGFDNSNSNRSLSVVPWSCYSLTPDSTELYVLPSLGSNVNQVSDECFNNSGNKKIEVSNNPAVHNGSLRIFWKAPNYGYFDNNWVTKPQPDE
jgi:hypothetical protein